MYAINLNEEKRILRATEEEFADAESYLVEALPTGDTEKEKDISNWLYVDEKYVYVPLPDPEPSEEYLQYIEQQNAINNLPATLAEIDEAICTLYELTLGE